MQYIKNMSLNRVQDVLKEKRVDIIDE